jgi:HTH-type transcriptional regulator/antitoxin HigA
MFISIPMKNPGKPTGISTLISTLIKSEEQYEAALDRIDQIFHPAPGSDEDKELELLVLLVKTYEDEHYPIEDPDPIEAIKIRMEDLGLKDKDLIPFIGDKTSVSKVLNRKRDLTVPMIRKLSKGLGIPAEVLIGSPVHDQ